MHVALHIHALAENEGSSEVVELSVVQGLERVSLGEALGRQVLDQLVDELRLRTPEDTDSRLVEFSFEVVLHADDGAALRQWPEYEFFNEAASWESLAPRLLAYVAACAHGARGDRIWADCETPAGTHAMNALLMQDRKWIPAYIDFLTSCDLDHEVDQAGDLDLAIETYGWHADTCALAAARLVSCHGQFGEEQFQGWLEADLGEYLATDEGRADFAKAVLAEFERDTEQMRHVLALPQEQCHTEFDFWLSFVALAFDTDTFNALQRQVHGRWERARDLAADAGVC
ncbi:hypothetical protein [Chitinolyticbacter albus]|uniref:hypothetical protein n=1 Tax=Chitinolyticbacter albus TaxID=2961951 RepID=UPI00210A44BB|nr:hypothetical protein [Chitinolyticbacter albus]